jgi:hypothetical protein
VTDTSIPGATTGSVNRLLRAEGAGIAIIAATLFDQTAISWWWFLGLFLLPDAAFAAYALSPRIGAAAYNATHSTLGPLALASVAFVLEHWFMGGVALIWLSHVGADRALGYGLKYPTHFRDTHLGRLARRIAR